MLAEVVRALACPVCRLPLCRVPEVEPGTLRCANGHAYDMARQGYLTLRSGGGPRHAGDDAAMVGARHAVLAAGWYGGLADRVAELAARPAGVVLDASTPALRRAARAHDSIAAVGADLWQRWPLQHAVAGLVLAVFAPRNGPEARRVLLPGGSLVVVTPASDHLAELVPALGLLSVDRDKDERLTRSLEPHLTRQETAAYTATLSLSHREVALLVGMTPSARHLAAAELAHRLEALPARLSVTISTSISRWTPAASA